MSTPFVSAAIGILLALGAGVPGAAAQPQDDDRHAKPSIVSERAALVRGETSWLAVTFEIEEGWHLYWPGYNDSGFPPGFEFTSNAPGVEIGGVVWPAPERYPYESGLLDHVYKDRVTLMFPVRVAVDSTAESVSIGITSDWLVCEVECVPESDRMAVTMPVVPSGSDVHATEFAEFFEVARRRVPQPWPDRPDELRAQWRGNTLVIESENAVRVAFYPHETSRPPLELLATGESESGSLTIEFRESDKPARGVVEVWETADSSRLYQLETRSADQR